MNKKTGQRGIDLIKHFESLHDGDLSKIGLQPKLCPAGIWTEGYGHAMMHNGKQLRGVHNKQLAYQLSKVKDEPEAEKLLADDLVYFEKIVNKLVKVQLGQNQFDAVVSFCFNVGEGNFQKSNLLKMLNNNSALVLAEFGKWNKARNPHNGRLEVLPGLTRRREIEKQLYLLHDEITFAELLKYVESKTMRQ